MKNQADPEYKADEEYPEWLFHMLDDQPTLNDYAVQGIGTLEPHHQKRALRLFNRERVKVANDESRKR